MVKKKILELVEEESKEVKEEIEKVEENNKTIENAFGEFVVCVTSSRWKQLKQKLGIE